MDEIENGNFKNHYHLARNTGYLFVPGEEQIISSGRISLISSPHTLGQNTTIMLKYWSCGELMPIQWTYCQCVWNCFNPYRSKLFLPSRSNPVKRYLLFNELLKKYWNFTGNACWQFWHCCISVGKTSFLNVFWPNKHNYKFVHNSKRSFLAYKYVCV